MVPSSVLATIASSELSTIAAIRWASANAPFCSVRSRWITDVPTIAPSASRIGETVSETGNTVPSLRTRLVSRCSTCWPASNACFCLATSRTAVIQQDVTGVAVGQVHCDRELRAIPLTSAQLHPREGIRHSLQQDLEPRRLREHLVPLSSLSQRTRNRRNT